jgi:hypothetical protein
VSTHRSALQRILLSYMSVMATVGDMKARGPALLRHVTGWIEPASGGVSMGLYYVKCALGWDFYARLRGGIFLPLLCVLLCGLYTCCRGVCHRSQRTSATFLGGCSVMIMFLAYSSQTRALLLGTYLWSLPSDFCSILTRGIAPTVFDCNGPVSGDFLLYLDLAKKCYDGNHVKAIVVSAFGLVFWALIYPASVYWMGRSCTSIELNRQFEFLFGKSVL